MSDAQSTSALPGAYRTRVGVDGYSLSIDEPISDEERGDSPSSPKSDDNDIIEVVFSLKSFVCPVVFFLFLFLPFC